MAAYFISMFAPAFEAAYTPPPMAKGNALTRDAMDELSTIIDPLFPDFAIAGIFVFAPKSPVGSARGACFEKCATEEEEECKIGFPFMSRKHICGVVKSEYHALLGNHRRTSAWALLPPVAYTQNDSWSRVRSTS